MLYFFYNSLYVGKIFGIHMGSNISLFSLLYDDKIIANNIITTKKIIFKTTSLTIVMTCVLNLFRVRILIMLLHLQWIVPDNHTNTYTLLIAAVDLLYLCKNIIWTFISMIWCFWNWKKWNFEKNLQNLNLQLILIINSLY